MTRSLKIRATALLGVFALLCTVMAGAAVAGNPLSGDGIKMLMSKAGIASWMNWTPMAAWREGTTGALGGQAVDMTLVPRTSLDNAAALPTSQQPPQQQQDFVA